MSYLYLAVAIVAEVVATTALKSSQGFTRLGPTLLVALGYGLAFYMLSLSLRRIPVGVAYAIWSGVGIVLITTLSAFVHKQKVDLPAAAGMGLIILGVAVIHLFSRMTVGEP